MIDVPEVLEDLQAIVAQFGDGHVYETPFDGGECMYREIDDTGEIVPSCIVGHVLARHGLLNRPYAISNLALHGGNNTYGATAFHIDFTPEAAKILGITQEAQDYKQTWGDALILAKQAAEDAHKADA